MHLNKLRQNSVVYSLSNNSKGRGRREELNKKGRYKIEFGFEIDDLIILQDPNPVFVVFQHELDQLHLRNSSSCYGNNVKTSQNALELLKINCYGLGNIHQLYYLHSIWSIITTRNSAILSRCFGIALIMTQKWLMTDRPWSYFSLVLESKRWKSPICWTCGPVQYLNRTGFFRVINYLKIFINRTYVTYRSTDRIMNWFVILFIVQCWF